MTDFVLCGNICPICENWNRGQIPKVVRCSKCGTALIEIFREKFDINKIGEM